MPPGPGEHRVNSYLDADDKEAEHENSLLPSRAPLQSETRASSRTFADPNVRSPKNPNPIWARSRCRRSRSRCRRAIPRRRWTSSIRRSAD